MKIEKIAKIDEMEKIGNKGETFEFAILKSYGVMDSYKRNNLSYTKGVDFEELDASIKQIALQCARSTILIHLRRQLTIIYKLIKLVFLWRLAAGPIGVALTCRPPVSIRRMGGSPSMLSAAAKPAIYLVGDADGGLMHANKAMAQGRVAALHAMGLPVEPFNPDNVLLATYTEPQAAQVGQVEGAGRDRPARVLCRGTQTQPDRRDGRLRQVSYRQEDRRLSGGLAVGPHAADVLAPVAVALQLKATIDQLAGIYVAHPTLSELVFQAARS